MVWRRPYMFSLNYVCDARWICCLLIIWKLNLLCAWSAEKMHFVKVVNKWSVEHPNKGVAIKLVLLLLEVHIWGSVLITHLTYLKVSVLSKRCFARSFLFMREIKKAYGWNIGKNDVSHEITFLCLSSRWWKTPRNAKKTLMIFSAANIVLVKEAMIWNMLQIYCKCVAWRACIMNTYELDFFWNNESFTLAQPVFG